MKVRFRFIIMNKYMHTAHCDNVVLVIPMFACGYREYMLGASMYSYVLTSMSYN